MTARISRSVVSPHLRITMPYAQSGALTEAAANLGAYQSFALNSAFDPDFSGGGLQPLGYDQYAQFYGRYRVLGIRVEVSVSNGSATVPILGGIYCSPQSTLPAVATAWRVQPTPSTKSKFLSPNAGGTPVAVFRANVPLAMVFGVTTKEFTDDQDFSANFLSSPARLAYMHVWIQGVAGAVASAYWSVRIWQDIELSQAVALSLS
jgi:hypothetical protein